MIIGILGLAVLLVVLYLKSQNKPEQKENKEAEVKIETSPYVSKWMFSYAEKDFYKELKEYFKDKPFEVFAKVRLFDLVKPADSKDMSARNKIQSKHVDFVICDEKLIARIIIELDDATHQRSDRIERDAFVDKTLNACGYSIIHITKDNREKLKEILDKEIEKLKK